MQLSEEAVEARTRLREYIRLTPVKRSHALGGDGNCTVNLKLENFQKTGSFKLRGAFNRLLLLKDKERSGEVVAASTGNHGAAVACAARALGLRARIFVPEIADPSKLAAITGHGAMIEKIGEDCIQAEAAARRFAGDGGLVYVSPYNDPMVIAGQGSLGVELHQQLDEIDAVFIALGGGGLIGGVGSYLKSVLPNIEIVACSPVNSAVMHHSMEAGRILELPSKPTLSDGTAGGVEAGSITFQICREVVDTSVLVSEEEIAQAMRIVIGEEHVLVEGAAGVAVAAFLKERARFEGKNVSIVLCGANASLDVLRKVLR